MFVVISGHTIYLPAVPADPVVLDLGANRGAFAKELTARFGGNLLLVEANPELAGELPAGGQFRTLNAAVAATPGVLPFHIAQNEEGSSLLTLPQTSAMGCVLRSTVEVPARTLADLLAATGPRVDLIKMDVEGAEVDILAGVDLQALAGIGQMTVEFHCDPMFGFGRRGEVDAVLDRLERAGFMVLDFSNGSRMDVLFVNRRRFPIGLWRRMLLRLRYRPPGWVGGARRLVPASFRARLLQAARGRS